MDPLPPPPGRWGNKVLGAVAVLGVVAASDGAVAASDAADMDSSSYSGGGGGTDESFDSFMGRDRLDSACGINRLWAAAASSSMLRLRLMRGVSPVWTSRSSSQLSSRASKPPRSALFRGDLSNLLDRLESSLTLAEEWTDRASLPPASLPGPPPKPSIFDAFFSHLALSLSRSPNLNALPLLDRPLPSDPRLSGLRSPRKRSWGERLRDLTRINDRDLLPLVDDANDADVVEAPPTAELVLLSSSLSSSKSRGSSLCTAS
mmetsp:Transcript_17392/g.50586  ORF Transcript_17392/g.50586 Transcript_17392/m.50586 type:complete len:261 (-) Transcript_17392:1891-2673(-)